LDATQARQAMSENPHLDRIDVEILAMLQARARMTNNELAERVHLSPSSCLQRVRKLERAGVLAGYQARIALARLCRSVTVVAQARLNNHEQGDFRRFEEAVAAMPEVIECLKVSGEYDYMLRLVCTDMAQYDELSDRLLNTGRGVAHLSSHVVLAHCKEHEGVPLRRLLQPDDDAPHA
jgi:DNA-binding Lrp family transcriptional regulator